MVLCVAPRTRHKPTLKGLVKEDEEEVEARLVEEDEGEVEEVWRVYAEREEERPKRLEATASIVDCLVSYPSKDLLSLKV